MDYEPVDAIITFYETFTQDGVAADGLPLFVPVLMVRKSKPPHTGFSEIATE